MPAITCLVAAGWILFTSSSNSIAYDTIDDETNLLQNPGFDEWEENKASNWSFQQNGQLSYKIAQVKGHLKDTALRAEITGYENGSVSIVSDEIEVSPSTQYDYKMFYLTDTRLALAVKEIDEKDNTTTKLLKQYPDYDYPWSTMGANFKTLNSTKKIQIAITFSEKGFVELDSGYVKQGQPPKTQPINSDNLLKNSSWSFTKSEGVNATGLNSNGIRSIKQLNKTTGQSGWVPQAVPVTPHQNYKFAFTYSSDTEAIAGVDYVLKNGGYRYETLGELFPNNSPAEHSFDIEIPADVKSIQPSLQLSQIGNLTSSNESLQLITDAKRFDQPAVSITFDDGLYSSYSNGASLLEQYGLKGTFYINPGLLDKPTYMTEKDVRNLMSRGHHIGSHTDTHIDLTSYHPEVLEKELDKSNKFLDKLGIQQSDFASPYGKYDDILLPIIESRQRSHRGTETGVNTKQNFNPYKLYGFFVRKTTTEQELREQLINAKTKYGWIILIYHDIEVNTSEFSVDRGTLEKHLRVIKESGINVMPVDRVLDRISQQR
jgi:peptidoglycan/xylan/chitin deacetylase (PgdA/CDA1 family)